jgi:uncharacterized protein (TIGR02246 family)
MRSTIGRAGVLLCLSAFGCGPPAPSGAPPAALQAEIAAANQCFMDAAKAGDGGAAAACYSSDAQVMAPGAPSVAGRDAIASFWGGAFAGVSRVDLQSDEVMALGTDGAAEVGHVTLYAKDGSVADEAKYIVLWKREEGAWRMRRDLWNSNRAGAPAPEAAAPEAAPAAEPSPE